MPSKNPPDVLSERYRLQEHLGTGGFAEVYLADDERLERAVAVKLLKPERLPEARSSERFLREARTVARLSHTNIVQVYDMGVESDWFYLVMEYIAGQALRDYLRQQQGPLPFDEAIAIASDILTGLSYAHSNGVIHRDIKPENILLTEDGAVKITDFGLARHDTDTRLTESGAFVGTLLYVAPEIIRGDRFDQRVDLYAVGATLYEMLTGQPPYKKSESLSLIHAVLETPLTHPKALNPEIPEVLAAVVIKLLDKDPQQRYPDARSVLDALPKPDALADMETEMLRQTMGARMAQTRLERIVRSSSGLHHRPAKSIDEDDTATPPPTATQDLLLYAAQEDMLEAVEVERRRMAHHLQEVVISQINLLLAQVNAYEQTISGTPQTRMALSVIATLVRQLLQQTYDLEASLHPAVLETLGLEPALESLSNQQRRISGTNITLSLQRMRERLPPQIELLLFRTAQDAIDRAVQQGSASQITIQLERSDEAILFSIADNGLQPAGEILRSARQRIRTLGGTLSLQASRYGGLEITVSFAIEEPIELTERELEVIQLLVEGLTNKEIAALLHVRPRTVKFHLDNIYTKLGVSTRTEAAIYALRHGWVRQQPPSPA